MTVLSMVPNDTPFLPPKVTDVAKETLRNFPHSKKVGNYLLGNTLGEGSFAKVKEALHIPTGERVAVKIIDKKKSREDSYVRKNLRREGKILQMIRHSNIVQLLEIMETQNSYYLVTELCRGGDLMDYISQRRKLPEQEVKKYIRQIVSAVDYLHRLGILHRDLKIENLLLDEFRDIKLIDFGLSNCIKVVHTKDGTKAQEYCVTQCGSPAYAAPELLGRRKYGPQVDIWSMVNLGWLGVAKVSGILRHRGFQLILASSWARPAILVAGVNMYAMLTGNLPFTVEPFNIKALHNKMVNSQMNPLPEGVTRECRDLIKKFLNPDPDRRIRLDDVMKHPWIASGVSNPMTRAPCPNKLKTETLDNSILKHMSENQGFRLGEIIRFVTGNVPSSATATYYLFQRKLQKYIGNLKASGKIAADNRLLNRTQQVSVVQINNKRQTAKIINTVHIQNDKQGSPAVNNNASQPPNKATNGETNNTNLDTTGGGDFTDLLTIRNKNDGTQIPRARSPVQIQKPGDTSPSTSPYMPNVAKKYMYSQRRNTLHSALEGSENKPSHIQETSTSLEDKGAPHISSNTKSFEDEPFRKRASTFPGKTQRPKITTDKLIKQRTETEESNVHKTATVGGINIVSGTNERQFQQHQGISTVKARINSIYRVDACQSPQPRQRGQACQSPQPGQRGQACHSPQPGQKLHVCQSPQPGQKGQSYHYVSNAKRPYQRRISGVNQNQPKQRDEVVPIDFEDRPSPARQYLTRPIRSSKIVRTKVENKDDNTLDEQVSEISSGSTRPSSSRNTSGSMGSNTGQTALPMISPSNTLSKRNA